MKRIRRGWAAFRSQKTEWKFTSTISRKDSVLRAQATGQPSFALEAYEIDKFKFDAAGLKLEFLPNENKMILLQGGGRFELRKE